MICNIADTQSSRAAKYTMKLIGRYVRAIASVQALEVPRYRS